MSKVSFRPDGLALQKMLKLEISRSDKSNQTQRQYMAKTGNMVNQLVGLGRGKPGAHAPDSISSLVHKDLVEDVRTGLGVVSALLNKGIGDSSQPQAKVGNADVAWRPLSKRWVQRKEKKSKGVYWRNTERLAKGFRLISGQYKQRMLAETGFTIRSRRQVYGKPFIYEIKLLLPTHKEFNAFNTVVPLSYIQAQDYSGTYIKSSSSNETDRKIGLLEGTGAWNKAHRPFITKLMQARGSEFRKRLMEHVRAADHKVNLRRGLSFNLKA